MTSDEESGFECWACLDFGHLPGIGPCPDCEPDAYAEHVLDCLEQRTDEGSDVA